MRNVDHETRTARKNARLGELLSSLDAEWLCEGLVEGRLKDLRIRLPTEIEPGVLLVVRAESAGGPFVAFVGGPNVGAVLLAWAARARADKQKWREDKPWGEG